MNKKENNAGKEKKTCFVIMPIGELSSYPPDHFRHVYEDIFVPAILKAGYQPKRADDTKASHMIQVGILNDIVKSPMVICDLSSRNPNVLFELGIRQAFDLPVVLVQEKDTPRIFDISTINTIDYRKELIYHEVIKDRANITKAIMETEDNQKGINSIIKLLEISSAQKANDNNNNDDANVLLFTLTNQLQKVINRLDDIDEGTLKNDTNPTLLNL
ncbi:MAG: hypothetical protein Q4E24_10145 [bacterium]|nr:hypothetical protein [bacterium]